MTGRNINVYIQEETYNKLLPLIKERKISRFINEAAEEKLQKQQQQSKEELRKEMIAGYKRNAKNQNLQNELKAFEAASVEDVLTTLEKRENEQNK